MNIPFTVGWIIVQLDYDSEKEIAQYVLQRKHLALNNGTRHKK